MSFQEVLCLTGLVYQDPMNSIIALLFQGFVFLTGLVYQDGAFSYDPAASVTPDFFAHIPDGFPGNVLNSPDVDQATPLIENSHLGNSQDSSAAIACCFLPLMLFYNRVLRMSSDGHLLLHEG